MSDRKNESKKHFGLIFTYLMTSCWHYEKKDTLKLVSPLAGTIIVKISHKNAPINLISTHLWDLCKRNLAIHHNSHQISFLLSWIVVREKECQFIRNQPRWNKKQMILNMFSWFDKNFWNSYLGKTYR